MKREKEQWVDTLPEYSIDHEISNYGRLRRKSDGYVHSISKTGNGYLKVTLNNRGTKKTLSMHRLVAIHFIQNPDNLPQVNHIDADKMNNHVTNLEWVDSYGNMRHASEKGLLSPQHGEHNPTSIYTDDQIHEVCRMLREGLRQCDVARKLNMDARTVGQIQREEIWSHIGSQYTFPHYVKKGLGESTVRFICNLLSEGKSPEEILELSDNPRIKRRTIIRIKSREMYKSISNQYGW
ncbi:MAG: HNH endonuclease [Psychroserpens sp.]|nr:HNH endonuclease [Psychroserpens sp.]